MARQFFTVIVSESTAFFPVMPSSPANRAPVVVLVGLKGEAALFAVARPMSARQSASLTWITPARLRCRTRQTATPMAAPTLPMNVLPIADLGDRGGRNDNDFVLALHDPNVAALDEQLHVGPALASDTEPPS